jgi:hypothetical protein
MFSCALFHRARRPVVGNIHSLRPGEVFAHGSCQAFDFYWVVGGKHHSRQDLGLLTVILGVRHYNVSVHIKAITNPVATKALMPATAIPK